MKRRYNWRTRLFAVIAENRPRSFVWGEWDCARFAAACVEEMTGEDFYAQYRDTYSDAVGAALALRAKGFRDLTDLASSLFQEIPISMAQVGDLAAIDVGEDGIALAIVLGDHLGCLSPQSGYGLMPRTAAVRTWRIG